MTAVITGDIINSEKVHPSVWMEPLKQFLKIQKIHSKDWAIYRGDEIQIALPNHIHSLRFSLRLKALIKSLSKNLDIKIAIGFGNTAYKTNKISESNGSVFIRSGRLYEQIKNTTTNIAIASPNSEFDETINIMLSLASAITDNWTQADAELIFILLDDKNKMLQSVIADRLGIKQSSVSRRKSRTGFTQINQLLQYFEKNKYHISSDVTQYMIAAEP